MPIVYAVHGWLPTTGALRNNPAGLPDPWVLDNYVDILTGELFWNSSRTASSSRAAVTIVVVSALAAYVFARFAFPGREPLFTLFALGLLFPAAVAILPLYILLRTLGLLNNPLGVALPQAAFGIPLTIIILRPFFQEHPGRAGGRRRHRRLRPVRVLLADPAAAGASGARDRGDPGARGQLERVPAAAARAWDGSVDAAAGRHELPQQYSQDAAGILAFTSLSMVPALLFYVVRGAPAHRRPDQWSGEGMTTQHRIRAVRRADEGACRSRPDSRWRRGPGPHRPDDPRREARPAGLVWSFDLVDGEALDAEGSRAAARGRHRPGHAGRRAPPTCRPAGSPSSATRSSATSSRRRAGDPGDHPRGEPPRGHGPGRDVLPAGHRPGRHVGSPLVEEARRPSVDTRARPAPSQALAPVFDVARDPRWGRIEETYGEDPYLAARLGSRLRARHPGDRGDGDPRPVIATAKHMVGHGLPEGGLNQAPSHIGTRELHDEFLFPFEAAVRVAGAAR